MTSTFPTHAGEVAGLGSPTWRSSSWSVLSILITVASSFRVYCTAYPNYYMSGSRLCIGLSIPGVIFLSIVGFLFDKQPLFTSLDVDDPDAAASECYLAGKPVLPSAEGGRQRYVQRSERERQRDTGKPAKHGEKNPRGNLLCVGGIRTIHVGWDEGLSLGCVCFFLLGRTVKKNGVLGVLLHSVLFLARARVKGDGAPPKVSNVP